MPFNRRTRDALISQIVNDVEVEVQNGASLIRRTLERAMAIAMGGAVDGLHGHIAFAALQLVIDRADDEFLVRWANIYMGSNGRKAATKAEFTIQVTGDAGGTTIAEGTRWTRADGATFESTAAFDLPASAPLEVEVAVRALAAGSAGNTEPGSTLTLESAIAGVEADATVIGDGSDAVGGGTDRERIDDLRDRLLEHLQNPPKAGAAADYVQWAKAVDGVTRAYCVPRALGPSTVVVMFVEDQYDSDGEYASTTFPASAKIAEVDDYIADRANATAVVTVQAPTEVTLDPEIHISPDTAAVRASIEAHINDLLLRQTGPQSGGSTVYRWALVQAISQASAAGLVNFDLVSPAADVSLTNSEIATLGTVTWDTLS